MSLLRRALHRFSPVLVALEIGLGLIVTLLALLWLRLPDSSFFWVFISVLLGLVIAGTLGTGQSWIVLRLAKEVRTRRRLLIGAASVLAAVLFWLVLSHWTGQLHDHDSQRASYLNSRFPHSMRNFFTYNHIYQWLGWLWATLSWIIAGILAAASCSLVLQRPRAMLRTFFSVTWWIALIVLSLLATFFAGLLLNWVPGDGLKVEMFSLVARLVVVVLLDGTVVALLLAILVETQATPAGTPETSQPLIAANP